MSFIQEIRKIDNKRIIWYNNDQCLGGLALKEEIKQERVKRKIKIANAIKCIMAVKRKNANYIATTTEFPAPYISKVLSGKKSMSKKFIKQLSIVFNLSIDDVVDIINYYLTLDDKHDDVTKDQLTMLYILQYTLNLKNEASKPIYKDSNHIDTYKIK